MGAVAAVGGLVISAYAASQQQQQAAAQQGLAQDQINNQEKQQQAADATLATQQQQDQNAQKADSAWMQMKVMQNQGLNSSPPAALTGQSSATGAQAGARAGRI